MSTKTKRRYYLHSQLKGFLTVKARSREVLITDSIINDLDHRTKELLFELRDKFGYNLQYTIPS